MGDSDNIHGIVKRSVNHLLVASSATYLWKCSCINQLRNDYMSTEYIDASASECASRLLPGCKNCVEAYTVKIWGNFFISMLFPCKCQVQ